MKSVFRKIAGWLRRLSFRSGLIVLIFCVLCYALSFAQMILPISIELKGILWVVFFGLAKASQYTAILILGKEGIRKIKRYFKSNKSLDITDI